MNALDNLTVAVTSYRRPAHLDRLLTSCRAAGIRRITISAVDADAAVKAVIAKHREGWLSYDVREVRGVGCNESWLIAVYAARTSRVIVMHDDDCFACPAGEFAHAYRTEIEPMLRSGIGFASWRACLLFDDGRTERTEYFGWESGVFPSSALLPIVGQKGRLSLSPIISVLDRQTVIHAAKEAEQTLRHNECLERPGMLLGTEILAYARHIEKFPQWYYCAKVLSHYGSHAGSGTIKAQNEKNGIARLALGYDRARDQANNPPPPMRPRLILVTFSRTITNPKERTRVALAEKSRQFLQGTGEVITLPLAHSDLPRMFDRPDNGSLAYVRDLLDAGCRSAMPEDIVVYSNDDLGLTIDAPSRIIAGVERGKGVTVCPRRSHDHPQALMRSVLNCRLDGGIDLVAVTPQWWALHREKMPDMLIGSDAWDTCFRVLAEEWADGGLPRQALCCDLHQWFRSRAYTDDTSWHIPHFSRWQKERQSGVGDEAGQHNRQIAREFFADRGNQDGLALLVENLPKTRRKINLAAL